MTNVVMTGGWAYTASNWHVQLPQNPTFSQGATITVSVSELYYVVAQWHTYHYGSFNQDLRKDFLVTLFQTATMKKSSLQHNIDH